MTTQVEDKNIRERKKWADPGVHPLFARAWKKAVQELGMPLPEHPLLVTTKVADAMLQAYGHRLGWSLGGRRMLMQMCAALMLEYAVSQVQALRKVLHERVYADAVGIAEATYRRKTARRRRQRERERSRRRKERRSEAE